MTDHVPRDCPKYDNCTVPICPLDKDWRKRAVMPSEAACPYLLELDKPGDPVARFAGLYDEFVIKAAVQLREDLTRERHPRYAYLPKQIARAATTPTMLEKKAAVSERFQRTREAQKKVRVQPRSESVEEEPPHQATPLPPGGL